jgi:hypothetical protein
MLYCAPGRQWFIAGSGEIATQEAEVSGGPCSGLRYDLDKTLLLSGFQASIVNAFGPWRLLRLGNRAFLILHNLHK